MHQTCRPTEKKIQKNKSEKMQWPRFFGNFKRTGQFGVYSSEFPLGPSLGEVSYWDVASRSNQEPCQGYQYRLEVQREISTQSKGAPPSVALAHQEIFWHFPGFVPKHFEISCWKQTLRKLNYLKNFFCYVSNFTFVVKWICSEPDWWITTFHTTDHSGIHFPGALSRPWIPSC